MKRSQVHVSVRNIEEAVKFYSTMFGAHVAWENYCVMADVETFGSPRQEAKAEKTEAFLGGITESKKSGVYCG